MIHSAENPTKPDCYLNFAEGLLGQCAQQAFLNSKFGSSDLFNNHSLLGNPFVPKSASLNLKPGHSPGFKHYYSRLTITFPSAKCSPASLPRRKVFHRC